MRRWWAMLTAGVWVLFGAAAAQAGVLLLDFAGAGGTGWTPQFKSPVPKAAAGGVQFPLKFGKPLLPFQSRFDRGAWDRAVKFDLSGGAAFDLELTCATPESVRAFGLYFKSGDGWYVATKPMKRAGRQRLRFHKSDFGTEGKVKGWGAIEAVRLSPWRADNAVNGSFTAHRLEMRTSDALAVVQGTASCPDDGEKAVAAKVAQRVSRMLLEEGLEHRLLTDEDVLAGKLGKTALVLLPYNPRPSAQERTALRAYLGRGGKLGVFYGSDAGLAESMGVKLTAYKKGGEAWRGLEFEPGWGPAGRTTQRSANIWAASPGPGTRVVGWWTDAAGRRTDAAVLAGARGFWMTHVLQSEDWTRKREMLAVLCGRQAPGLWMAAAQHAMGAAGEVAGVSGGGAAVAALRARAKGAARPAELAALLAAAEALGPQMAAAMTGGRPEEAWRLARRQRQLLLHADACLHKGKPGERVGVWDHEGTGFGPGRWSETAAYLAACGVNTIFPNVAWGGQAHYPSKVLPASKTLQTHGDQLAACISAARANGQEVHAWMVLWKLDGAPADFTDRMKKEGRLQVTASGTTRPWLSPHHPANRTLMLDAIAEMAAYPGLAGIHLDYVRLPDALSCYSPTTRARFEAATGLKAAAWPKDVQTGGKLYNAWRLWRSRDITAFVRQARDRVKQVAPNVKFSCAVYGVAAPDGGGIAQQWPEWLRLGLVDFLVPMDYTESESEFAGWLKTQTAYSGSWKRIWAGIGVTADESRLDAAEVARQITLARAAGCPGVVLFSLGEVLRDEVLPVLREGVIRPER